MKQANITIIDFGMGNIQSVRNALERIGCLVQVSSDPREIYTADALVLPGVGAFGEAMNNLTCKKLIKPLKNAVVDEGKPILGICLGMQLLADDSDERGGHKGLSLISGHVKKIPVTENLLLPHIGWNDLLVKKSEPLFNKISDGDAFYFVHSHHFECETNYISATTDYGVYITASIQKERIFAVQFHPERSQRKGLILLKNFVNYVEETISKSTILC